MEPLSRNWAKQNCRRCPEALKARNYRKEEVIDSNLASRLDVNRRTRWPFSTVVYWLRPFDSLTTGPEFDTYSVITSLDFVLIHIVLLGPSLFFFLMRQMRPDSYHYCFEHITYFESILFPIVFFIFLLNYKFISMVKRNGDFFFIMREFLLQGDGYSRGRKENINKHF